MFDDRLHVENEQEDELKDTSSSLGWIMFNYDEEKKEKVSKGSLVQFWSWNQARIVMEKTRNLLGERIWSLKAKDVNMGLSVCGGELTRWKWLKAFREWTVEWE